MKEIYFKPETIRHNARKMLNSVGYPREPRLKDFSPRDSAFLILDMQEYFLSPASHAFIPSAAAILPRLNELREAYAALKLPTVFTRHINMPNEAGMMSQWWRDLITAENPLSEIVSDLDSTSGKVLQKSQYDAFYGTDLEAWLKESGVHQLVVGGVMTHLCCETTARSAFVRGFQVFFLVDGTATYNKKFHQATLLNISHGFGTLVLVDEILAAMDETQ